MDGGSRFCASVGKVRFRTLLVRVLESILFADFPFVRIRWLGEDTTSVSIDVILSSTQQLSSLPHCFSCGGAMILRLLSPACPFFEIFLARLPLLFLLLSLLLISLKHPLTLLTIRNPWPKWPLCKVRLPLLTGVREKCARLP